MTRTAIIITTKKMALELKQIQEILQKPKKAQIIRRADLLQKRLRFHTETNILLSDSNMPTTVFLDWVKTLLPKDKYNIFLQLFKFPLPTSAVVEDVYRELERVFYSRNSSSSYQFTTSELEEDWANYRINNLHEPEIWKTEGWKKMQVSPNSVLVVDLPAEQNSFRPEPYFYWLEITDVIDYETCDGTCIHWIVFRQPENRVAVFDDTYIRVYELDENKLKIKALVTEVQHGLGFCPARFFWSTKLNEKSIDLKKNPITKELSNLDWYLFFSTGICSSLYLSSILTFMHHILFIVLMRQIATLKTTKLEITVMVASCVTRKANIRFSLTVHMRDAPSAAPSVLPVLVHL